MPNCAVCKKHYFLTYRDNSNKYCEDCEDYTLKDTEPDDEDTIDLNKIVNPSGKTKPVFYD